MEPPFSEADETLRDRLSDFWIWHSELLGGWSQRYTPDLTPGERKWLDENAIIYLRRYERARERLLEIGYQLLGAATVMGMEVPLVNQFVTDVASEREPARNLDKEWSDRADQMIGEAVGVLHQGARRGAAFALISSAQPSAQIAIEAPEENWVTVTDAKVITGLAKSTISKMCDKKIARCRGNGASRRVDANSLVSYLRARDEKDRRNEIDR